LNLVIFQLADGNKAKDQVKSSAEQTIKELKVDYLDLFLVHSPFKSDVPIKETWEAMESLVDKELVRSIGVSNFRVKELKELLSTARIKPTVNQIEYHPFVVNQELVDFCNEQNIVLMSYSGLAPIIHYKGPLDDVLAQLSEKYATSPSKILQMWLLAQDIGIVTTTSKEHRMKEFFILPNETLSKEDVEQISSIGKQHPQRKYWADVW